LNNSITFELRVRCAWVFKGEMYFGGKDLGIIKGSVLKDEF
jgi:hypothetical protein